MGLTQINAPPASWRRFAHRSGMLKGGTCAGQVPSGAKVRSPIVEWIAVGLVLGSLQPRPRKSTSPTTPLPASHRDEIHDFCNRALRVLPGHTAVVALAEASAA